MDLDGIFITLPHYEILIMTNNIHTHNDISNLQTHIPQCSGIFVIIDKNISDIYGNPLDFPAIEIIADETTKNMETVSAICEKLLALGADRDCFIVGIGGGVTTDIAGFAASIYKRGVKFGFVPTTLLSQVDAAIGGKNGVNLSGFKNIIGNIRQPLFVYETPLFLKSLSLRVFREGVAEILKTFAIFNPGYFETSAEFFGRINPATMSDSEKMQLADIIAKCAGYKAETVARDEFEKGERRLLNFGHTFAHAIEKYCLDNPEKETLMHGEAVACGMVLAAKVSMALGKCTEETVSKITNAVIKAGLPAVCDIKCSELVGILKTDKKVSGENIHFITPYAIGDIRDELIRLDKLYEIAENI